MCSSDLFPSHDRRGGKANEIRNLLKDLGFDYSERAYDEDCNQIKFRVKSEGGSVIRELSPDKKLNKRLVSLPLPEARALFDALIDGDGHRPKNKKARTITFIQKDKETVDWFCILAMRLGYKPTIGESYDGNGNHTYRVYCKKGRNSFTSC